MEYKPLTDLSSDESACEKLFEFCLAEPAYHFCRVEEKSTFIQGAAKCVNYEGDGRCSVTTEMYISHEGFFFFYQGDEEIYPDRNYFEIVDFIRSLGYSA